MSWKMGSGASWWFKPRHTKVENIDRGMLTERLIPGCLDLAIRPPGNLDDKVDDLLVRLIWIEGDVVPERCGASVFL